MTTIVPIERRISYSKFGDNFDVAYSSVSNDVICVLIKDDIYRVMPAPIGDMVLGGYIINSFDNTKLDYSYCSVYEFKSVKELKSINITNITGLKEYTTSEEIKKFIEEKREHFSGKVCKNLTGLKIFKNLTLMIKINDQCEHPHIGIITSDTKINVELSTAITNPKIVDNVKILTDDNTVEITISQSVDTSIDTSVVNTYKKYGLFEIETANDSASTKLSILKKSILLEMTTRFLKDIKFMIGDKFSFKYDHISYTISISSTDDDSENRCAYLLETKNIKLVNLATSHLLVYDEEAIISHDDIVTLKIISSDIKILHKPLIIDKLRQKILNSSIRNQQTYTIFISCNKIVFSVENISTQSNQENNCGILIYKCAELPKFVIKDNISLDTYVVENLEVQPIVSVILKLTKQKRYDSSDVLKQLFNLSDDVTIEPIDVKTFLKKSNSCTFVGKTYTYSGIKMTIESLEYQNSTIKNLDHVIGQFIESTQFGFNKKTSEKGITIADTNYTTSININIETIREMAKKMEDAGMFGMEKYIDIITNQVFITRTNLVDPKLIPFIKPSKGIILYGPPGTGKTTFARNIATILGCDNNFVKFITATEIMSKYFGESEHNFRKLFQPAIDAYQALGELAPLHILIIDELDAILGKRTDNSTSCSATNSIVNQFLGLMDGLVQFSNLVIIGITNRLDSLDKACIRPGRFGCKIFIENPSMEQREKIIKLYHGRIFDCGIIEPIDYVEFASLTDGCTGADIENIFANCIGEYTSSVMMGNKKIITRDNILEKVMEVRN